MSFILLQTGSGEFAGGAPSWLILGVAVAGLIAALLVGLASQSWSRPTATRDRPDQTEEGARYMAARVEVLEILIRRGLVERGDVDITEMMEMPLGTWNELDKTQS